MIGVDKTVSDSDFSTLVKVYVDSTGIKHPVSVNVSTTKGGEKREFYAEFSDYDSMINAKLLQEGRLKFNPPGEGEQEYYEAIRSKYNPVGKSLYNGYSVKMRGTKEEVGKEFFNWMCQFSNISYKYEEESDNESN